MIGAGVEVGEMGAGCANGFRDAFLLDVHDLFHKGDFLIKVLNPSSLS